MSNHFDQTIKTQADLDEYKDFQVWMNKVLDESISDIRYAVKEGEEGMQKGHKKIEMFKHIQKQIMRQTDFSLSSYNKYREIK
ncbi:hypothetical protein [Marinilactibacillus psychrotolerans]|uniref:Uncharacterized protein n=1 Tax=Marinilactibacillus psychrotolerans TaxID=191770 RepID=A0AAV3WWN9_9LACT|nr:hypothetical protein [Marinilactibacillus psychrotolerans]GEL67268.1 hypothetical protein MPS01_14230 [Marinilactibacillus psychrotolerans]GEQ36072.1 hypothetical protein M132T_15800 [Marinilactibacillus psychrotolerans]SDC62441.1 hypothetical protein SAMN04488013_10783 [Marinilactibacillus psychrotolerans]